MRLAVWMLFAGAFALDSIGTGPALEVYQVSQAKFFTLTAKRGVEFTSVVLDVGSTNCQLAFTMRAADYPEFSKGKFVADIIDVAAWQYNLSQHSLSMRGSSFATEATLYLGVFLLSSDNRTEAVYSLHVYDAGDCPYLCHFKGTCTGGQCRCTKGYIGFDCRVPASSLSAGRSLDFPLTLHSWHLFSLGVADTGSTQSEGVAFITLQFADPADRVYTLASLGNSE